MTERMSVLAVNMNFNVTQTLRVMVLLLMSRIVQVQGTNHQLQCVNDYLSTINCTLQSHLPSDLGPFWLRLTLTYDEQVFLCPLSGVDEHFFCSVKMNSDFVDSDVYKISLCHEEDGRESCELLDDNFKPVLTIKPQPPCCLTVTQNSSQHRFSWKSTYEQISNYTDLVIFMKYQLRFYPTGYQHNGTRPHDVYTDVTTFTLGDEKLIPDSEYVAKVRSSPNQAFYKGHWSDWSGEVHWRTELAEDEESGLVFKLEDVLIPVCLLVPLILIVCLVPIKKWKQSVFIPTPEPYFQTLYSDCQGDFKSWVIMKEKTIVDVPKTEKTLPIDSLLKCEDPHQPESRGYLNVTDLGCPVFEVDVPSEPEFTYQSPPPRSPAEGDSGCWLSSDQSSEKGLYCNNYCTLSTFQQSALGTAQHGSESLRYDTCVVTRDDYIGDIDEIQGVCV